MDTISITTGVKHAMIEHARKLFPIEACGYLGGAGNKVTEIYQMTNMDSSEEHFSFDPKEQFDAMRRARNAGISLIANYHSHPATPARPSLEDIKLAYDPNIAYFIVSLAQDQPDIKAFRISQGKSEPINVLVVD
jgi:[CysO sulfur-carrier protein]-S-L-cysteine hydrolase